GGRGGGRGATGAVRRSGQAFGNRRDVNGRGNLHWPTGRWDKGERLRCAGHQPDKIASMNEETFLDSLLEDPGDEVTWSALADWLEDDGQTQRAELLRLTRRMLPTPVSQRGEMPRRHAELLAAGTRPVIVQGANSIGMGFALVPGGRFLMGSPPEEQDRNEDEPLHEVEITRPFWLGVFPVTQGQWRA